MPKQSIPVVPVYDAASGDLGQVSDRLREIRGSISRRAFEIFEADGGSCGHELDHWFRAESEILQTTPIEIQDFDGTLIVRAEVPGFKAHEIEVMVEPWRLIVVGKRESKDKRKSDKVSHSEQGTRILRIIDFFRKVDIQGVTATLKNGVLELTLPKAVVGNAAGIGSKVA